jgi:pyrroloquinoline quinone biosynthesis protein B
MLFTGSSDFMHIRILGSAAGGGFPQWNCACANCSAVRAGNFAGKPRTQAQVAVSSDGQSWFLLGASPDLRSQIESTPELHPRVGLRQSPVSGVVLASADLDHVLGLLLLRELQPLRVFATASVLRILREDNSFSGMLNRVPRQVEWSELVPGILSELTTANSDSSGLVCTAISSGTRYPAYVKPARAQQLQPTEAVAGLMIEFAGKRLAYFSAVSEVNETLLETLDSADVLLFDGTFWSDDELIRVDSSGATARQMGHIPVGGAGGSLRQLALLHKPRKIFLHINNTNPMLNESGAEYQMAREAGWEIAEDGWQFTL